MAKAILINCNSPVRNSLHIETSIDTVEEYGFPSVKYLCSINNTPPIDFDCYSDMISYIISVFNDETTVI